MHIEHWAEFPHRDKAFQYEGKALAESWTELHRGDCEPFPDAERVSELDPKCPNPEKTAGQWQQAWRDYHAGRFAKAVDNAVQTGLCAHAVANKASGIYADYLEEDEKKRLAIYQSGIERAETAIEAFPDDPNAHYFHAFLLGRYSQCISVAKALAQGVGGRIRQSLDRALELAPKHAEARTASGLYHAEIIDKVGKLVGGMTYGAKADKAVSECQSALKITPKAPIAHIEYGNALYLLYGDRRLDESNKAYEKAAGIKPIDAMQKLDVEYAKSYLNG
jgi:tetratricopeptide (TPR) repeat protein